MWFCSTCRVRANKPHTRCTRPRRRFRFCAVGLADSDDESSSAQKWGVSAYVTREASIEELVDVVRSAAKGEMLCSSRVAAALARRVATLSNERIDHMQGN